MDCPFPRYAGGKGREDTGMDKLIRKKKTAIIWFSLFILFFLSVGCNKSEETGVLSRLVIGVGRDLYFGPSSPTFLHGSLNVWEGLTSLNDQLEPRPQLAESWDMKEDARVWVFHLRKGVFFHDGEVLNSDVVVKNIKRMKKNPKFDVLGTYRNVKSVMILGELSVGFSLYRPDPVFPARLSYFASPIFSSGSLDPNGNVTRPMGTGPFMLKKHTKGEAITLKRNERYYLGSPRLDEIIFKYIPDPSTRVFALKAGEIDAVVDIGGILPEQVSLLKKDKNINILTRQVATTHYLLFNTQRLPFSSQKLRNKASAGIDRNEMVETILEGYALPAKEFFTPLADTWIIEDCKLPKDRVMDRTSKSKFSHSATEVLFVVNAGLSKRWPYKPISEVIQSYLRDLGFNVEIRMLEMGAWKDALKRGEFDLSLSPHTLMAGDPDFFFSPWIHSRGRLNLDRGIHYENPEVDDLIETARSEIDRKARKELYRRLQKIIASELPLTPLFHDVAIYAFRDRVEDLRLDVFFKPSLHRAWVKFN